MKNINNLDELREAWKSKIDGKINYYYKDGVYFHNSCQTLEEAFETCPIVPKNDEKQCPSPLSSLFCADCSARANYQPLSVASTLTEYLCSEIDVHFHRVGIHKRIEREITNSLAKDV